MLNEVHTWGLFPSRNCSATKAPLLCRFACQPEESIDHFEESCLVACRNAIPAAVRSGDGTDANPGGGSFQSTMQFAMAPSLAADTLSSNSMFYDSMRWKRCCRTSDSKMTHLLHLLPLRVRPSSPPWGCIRIPHLQCQPWASDNPPVDISSGKPVPAPGRFCCSPNHEACNPAIPRRSQPSSLILR